MSPLHGTYTPWNLLPHSTGIKNLQQTESCDHVFLHIFVLFWHRACKYKMYLIPFKEGKRIRKLAKTFLEIFKDPIEICYFSGCLLFIDTEKFWSCNNKFIVALSQMEFWSFLGTLSLSVDKEIHFQKKPPQCCSHLQENRDELWLPQVFKKKDEKRKKKKSLQQHFMKSALGNERILGLFFSTFYSTSNKSWGENKSMSHLSPKNKNTSVFPSPNHFAKHICLCQRGSNNSLAALMEK